MRSFADAIFSRIAGKTCIYYLYLHALTVLYFTCSPARPPEINFVSVLSYQTLKWESPLVDGIFVAFKE